MAIRFYIRLNGKKIGSEFTRIAPVIDALKTMELQPGDVAEAVDDSADGVTVKLRREEPNVKA